MKRVNEVTFSVIECTLNWFGNKTVIVSVMLVSHLWCFHAGVTHPAKTYMSPCNVLLLRHVMAFCPSIRPLNHYSTHTHGGMHWPLLLGGFTSSWGWVILPWHFPQRGKGEQHTSALMSKWLGLDDEAMTREKQTPGPTGTKQECSSDVICNWRIWCNTQLYTINLC